MAREAVYIIIILEEMGHKQPPTPLQTYNYMAEEVVNGKIQPKITKAMDMRFHWLREREYQEQFRIYWGSRKIQLRRQLEKLPSFKIPMKHSE